GVILNLSIWFGLKVLFTDFVAVSAGPVSLDMPLPDSLDWRAGVLAVLAAVVLFRFHAGVIVTLIVSAAASFAISALI
ncbi:MAG: chromate transporter, partial [Alphaproteobacteria bacterium]|nr:chromate transporter [Alphaproteobacteria bacterium]